MNELLTEWNDPLDIWIFMAYAALRTCKNPEEFKDLILEQLRRRRRIRVWR